MHQSAVLEEVEACLGDNLGRLSYAEAMARGKPHLILTIDAKEPIELGAFVGAFTSLGNEYERYIKQTNPDLEGEADMYVREVRKGSIIVDMLPWITIAAPFIDDMDKALIVEQFVRTWGKRFKSLFEKNSPVTPETRSELKDWSDAVRAIATDPDATATLEAATFEDGKKKIRAAFKFTTIQARNAQKIIDARVRRLDTREHVDHTRVLMRFTRSDIGDVSVGKPSGEKVQIEELSPRSLALVYGSELAEERIKHEIREADENVYKKGFVVDVNVRSSGGRPIAYAITNVHQVVDLPDDED